LKVTHGRELWGNRGRRNTWVQRASAYIK